MKRRTAYSNRVTLLLVAICLGCYTADGQIITPTSAAHSSATNGTSSANLINSSGLFGAGGELAQLHVATSFVAGNVWITNAEALPGGQLTFALPGPSTVDGAHLWQYGQQPCCTARGVSVFDASFSTDGGVTFPTTVSGLTLNQHDDRYNEARQTVTFAPQAGVTHVRFTNMDDFPTGGNPGFLGLGEVRFDSNAASTLSNVSITGADITTVADISQNGTLEYAFNTGGPAITVAGIDFAAGGAPLGNQFTGANPNNLTDDANFNTLLNSETYGTSLQVLELAGLTAGDDYELQLLMTDNRDASLGARTVDFNADSLLFSTAGIGIPQSVLVNFTAFDDTFNLQLFGTVGNPSYIGGYQLRNVTAIPEPTSVLLWVMLGAVTFGFGYRKIRKP